MEPTTNQCEICQDRGVIWTEQWPGAYQSQLCQCHTPEYWAEYSNRTMAALQARMAEIRQRSGDDDGEMAEPRRQEHQLSGNAIFV